MRPERQASKLHNVACDFYALSIDAIRPAEAARFWSGLLGWQPSPSPSLDPDGGIVLLPTDNTGLRLRFLPTQEPKTGANRIHFHLTSNLAPQAETVARALALGAQHIDVGQKPDEDHVVLADPEGNELCVIEAGNNWLKDHGFFGDLACDGSREVGLFWSAALQWPLVWDQDGETAIRDERGGPKIAWGGPSLDPRLGRDRIRFELALPAGVDREAEVARLVALGATDKGQDPTGAVTMTDPDGNEFRILAPR